MVREWGRIAKMGDWAYDGGMLEQRVMIPELMDEPGLDARVHEEALAGLRRLNRAARAAEALARPVVEMVARRGLKRVEMLDVACGGGDVPVKVGMAMRGRGIEVSLTLTVRSATALAGAEAAARAAGIGVRAVAGDAPGHLPEGEWDFVTNSLFLHHLKREEVVATLAQMARRARAGVVVSDLRRSLAGYVPAWVMCRVLSRSRIVHHDGPVSVRAAWTMEELRGMAAEAGMTGARVRGNWPSRMLLVWERG
jgi:2-polyprenyl-3-methyl-5-hydroxy-6-metoxy-1,4-benzoquinol methylase